MIKYKLRKLFFVTLMTGILCGLFYSGVQYLNNYEPPLTQVVLLDGSPAPPLSEMVPNDTEVLILVYWHSSCSYCRALLVEMEPISKLDHVFVVAINVGDNAKTVRKAVADMGLTFPIVMGLQTAQEFSGDPLRGFPYTFVGLVEGYIDWYGSTFPPEFQAVLEEYL